MAVPASAQPIVPAANAAFRAFTKASFFTTENNFSDAGVGFSSCGKSLLRPKRFHVPPQV
ncbi:MAG: hypothetical protein WA776_08900 [Xanthobacteraceae bacterium]